MLLFALAERGSEWKIFAENREAVYASLAHNMAIRFLFA